MSSDDLLIDELRRFEELCRIEWLRAGFKRVRKNKGSPGIDGVTVAEFESRLDEELSQLQQELERWTYKPALVRRVEIPKPGGKGIRLLGVPTVRDRVVQATLEAAVRTDLRAAVLRARLRFSPWAKPTPSGGGGARDRHRRQGLCGGYRPGGIFRQNPP